MYPIPNSSFPPWHPFLYLSPLIIQAQERSLKALSVYDDTLYYRPKPYV